MDGRRLSGGTLLRESFMAVVTGLVLHGLKRLGLRNQNSSRHTERTPLLEEKLGVRFPRDDPLVHSSCSEGVPRGLKKFNLFRFILRFPCLWVLV